MYFAVGGQYRSGTTPGEIDQDYHVLKSQQVAVPFVRLWEVAQEVMKSKAGKESVREQYSAIDQPSCVYNIELAQCEVYTHQGSIADQNAELFGEWPDVSLSESLSTPVEINGPENAVLNDQTARPPGLCNGAFLAELIGKALQSPGHVDVLAQFVLQSYQDRCRTKRHSRRQPD